MRTYEKYKDSGISWLGKVPENWEVCKVKHHYKLVTGFTPATKVAEFYDTNNGHTWITIADLKGKVVTDSTNKISDFYLNEYHQEKVKEGSLLYSFKLSVGQVAFAGKDLYTNEAIAAFQNSDKVNLKFFFYAAPLFIIHNSNINIYGAHILNQDLIKNAYTVFPPLPEQEAIANYLDKKTAEIDKIIAEREKKIELLNELKSSIISRAVTKGINPHAKMKDSGIDWIGEIPEGWELCRFKNFMFLITNVTTSGKKIGLENIESGTGKYIYTESEFEGNGVAFKINDIVYGKLRPYLRKVWRADFDGNAVGDFFVFRNKKNSLSSFLKYVLLSDNFTQFANGTTYGAKMPRVASNAILDQQYFLPPLTEQEKISNYLDQKTTEIDYNVSMIRKECILYKEYKQSLISEVVTGKRKVID